MKLALLDDHISTALEAAAATIAAGSAFARTEGAFFIECTFAVECPAQFGGRFLHWEIEGPILCIVVAADLPNCADTTLWIPLGRVDAIQETSRPAFLQAVQAAFPITEASTFTARSSTTTPPVNEPVRALPRDLRATIKDRRAVRQRPANTAVTISKRGKKNQKNKKNHQSPHIPKNVVPPSRSRAPGANVSKNRVWRRR